MEILNSIISIPLIVTDPSSRLYWPFLLLSLGVLASFTKKDFFKDFTHPSSVLDLKIFTLNSVLKILVFPFFLITAFSVSVQMTKVLYLLFPTFGGLQLSDFIMKGLLTFIAFILNDFFRFFHHYLMHKVPGLRKLHRTHHSAVVLTPLTLFRAHPLEAFIASLRNLLSLGCTLAIFSFLSQKPIHGWDILGVNIFGFIFNGLLANLRHSPMPISFGAFEYLFISPRMHQIHHSNNPNHFNKNYGVALALWDQLVGSYYRPSKEESNSLSFGLIKNSNELTSKEWEEATTLKGALFPFKTHKELKYENKSFVTRPV